MTSLILASTSFRRQELLTWLGLPFSILAPDFDEEEIDPRALDSAAGYVKTLALGKLLSVINQVETGVILSADTTVLVDDQILGKPQNFDHAREMLQQLQGRSHQVFTAVSLGSADNGQVSTFVEESMVTFRPLSRGEIDRYIQTSEPMGKAGGYAIQGKASQFVDKVEGSWTNVIGLPLVRLAEELPHFGLQPTTNVEKMIQQSLGVSS